MTNKKHKMKTLIRPILLTLVLLATTLTLAAKTRTVRQMMDIVAREQGVSFVYDASLPLDVPFNQAAPKKHKLDQWLDALFQPIGITWTRQGHYVMLHRKTPTDSKPQTEPQTRRAVTRYTLSGFVRDSVGESLIRATIYDATSGAATTTNAYGFFSLTLNEGDHDIKASYLGYADSHFRLRLQADVSHDFALQPNATLGQVTVTADRNSTLLNEQTGHRQLRGSDIGRGFALLSSPDLVKALQLTSGVAPGVELMSGLYVHGGGNDENLFLLDGTPLYQVNHTLGLFSAFNTDIVKRVDFYKSGFPARYAGRLSSVTDVRTKDGDHTHTHGGYSIGTLDGRFWLEGPIGQDHRTSYVFGLRRSWLDLLSTPIFALVNKGNDDKVSLGYLFYDMNAKLSHIFSNRSRLSLSLYSGRDRFSTKDDSYFEYSTDANGNIWSDHDITRMNMRWGNRNVALNWNYVFSPKLFANFNATFTQNYSRYNYSDNDSYGKKGEEKVSYLSHGYRSMIYDTGADAQFDYRPSSRHHIRFGTAYTWHVFRPQTQAQRSVVGTAEKTDTISTSGSNRNVSHELNLFAEDSWRLAPQWSLNAGFNASLFNTDAKTFMRFDPRLAMRWQMSRTLAAKLSYTMMTQYVHRITNSFLDLPTDYWVSTTAKLEPMRAWQLTAGLYAEPSSHLSLSVEAYYKQTNHMLQYASWAGIEPPADHWDENVMDGRGKAYGIEADIHYHTTRLDLAAAYTLSWNKRHYDEWYDGWFADKFDNRHKLNITMQWAVTKKINLTAAFTMRSGNRMTVPTQIAPMPDTPGGSNKYGNYSYDVNTYIYERPNNVSLPMYHRLDLGADFHHTTKHGHERIWNVSIYNAYCHLNAMYVELKQDWNGSALRAKAPGFIPILPSVSYTIKF